MNKNGKVWIIIIVGILLVLSLQQPKEIKKSAGPGGATITRTVTPDSVASGGVFTVRITATKGTEDMAGIIKEVKPSSFTFYDSDSWMSTFDSKVEDYYNNNLDIPFAESGTSGYYEYKLQAGTSSGTLSGTIKWEDGTIDDIGSKTLLVVGCTADSECSALDTECKTGKCVSGACTLQNKADGTTCTGGDCQNGECIPYSCTPDCSCETETCIGQTCSDGCGGNCPGTKTCAQTCSQAGGICMANACSAYSNCQTITGTCTTGNCCSGTCTTPAQTCSQLGGITCTTGQTCSGQMTSTSDTTLCCVGGTCTTPAQTCEEKLNCEIYEECNDAGTVCETAGWVWMIGLFFGGLMAFRMVTSM